MLTWRPSILGNGSLGLGVESSEPVEEVLKTPPAVKRYSFQGMELLAEWPPGGVEGGRATKPRVAMRGSRSS